MPRIAYRDPATLSEKSRAVYGEAPANAMKMLATASEPMFHAYMDMGTIFLTQSSVPPKLRELAILRVGHLSRSQYEVFQHEALSRHVGLSEAEIAAIAVRDMSKLDAEQVAVMNFVDDIVTNVRASDDTLEAVKAHLTDSQIIDLMMVSGLYMIMARMLETVAVEIDVAPVDWDKENLGE
ncbi:carboxymuconolactone decarboxylase family protein [soil metagenome]